MDRTLCISRCFDVARLYDCSGAGAVLWLPHVLDNDHLLHTGHGQNSDLTAKWPVYTQTSSAFVPRSSPPSLSLACIEVRAKRCSLHSLCLAFRPLATIPASPAPCRCCQGFQSRCHFCSHLSFLLICCPQTRPSTADGVYASHIWFFPLPIHNMECRLII